MATFAKLGLNGKVIDVQSISNNVKTDSNGVEQETLGIDFLTELTNWPIWKQTSYNNNFRKNHASIGYTYDEDRDAFIPPRPYASWTLNETSCTWECPVSHPQDGNNYIWNEETQQWDLNE